jgi:hypothetical protein
MRKEPTGEWEQFHPLLSEENHATYDWLCMMHRYKAFGWVNLHNMYYEGYY